MSTLTVGDALERLMAHNGVPFYLTAYDGSTAGSPDSPVRVDLKNERGLRYILTAPGDLGFARAYVKGDIEVAAEGVHPGDPYPALSHLMSNLRLKLPGPIELAKVVTGLGLDKLKPPPVPNQEMLPKWRRVAEGLMHSKSRDAVAIQHHYDVSNKFYEMVLGPSMAYTCAVYPTLEASLEEAQYEKFDLVARKLDLKPGQTLLDIGCGWGGMVRHAAKEYGVKAIGVTLSKEQASWAQEENERQGLAGMAEVRHGDYRDVPEGGFDALSSIGLTEHIGVKNYPAYFGFMRDKIVDGGRVLCHTITRPTNHEVKAGQFIDRYIFPDGEIIGSGRVISEMQNAGLEVRHEENLREHYAMTCRDWNRNLVENWDACVAEASLEIAKLWGVYLAGSRIGFERNEIQLHQMLGVKVAADGTSGFPLRPTWLS